MNHPYRGPPSPGQKLDENEFLVDQRVTLALLEEGADVPGPTLIPESEQGRVGLWVTGLRPDSLLGRLGIENGDRVESINGMAMHSPKDLLEVYAHPPMSNHLSVVVTRRGSKVRLEYYLV